MFSERVTGRKPQSMHGLNASPSAVTNHYTKTRQQGFSLFELTVVITSLAILMGVLLQRLHYLQERAEKTAMELTVMNMGTGLRYKLVALMMDGRMQELSRLLDENPINWLQNPPTNYQGEFTTLAGRNILPGNWYFDVKEKQIVYRLKLDDHFLSKQHGVSEIRFKASSPNQNSKLDDAEYSPLLGITLNAVFDSQWFKSLVL